MRSLGTAGAVANARAELVRVQERTVQAELVVRRVNHEQAPLRPKVVAADRPHAHRRALVAEAA